MKSYSYLFFFLSFFILIGCSNDKDNEPTSKKSYRLSEMRYADKIYGDISLAKIQYTGLNNKTINAFSSEGIGSKLVYFITTFVENSPTIIESSDIIWDGQKDKIKEIRTFNGDKINSISYSYSSTLDNGTKEEEILNYAYNYGNSDELQSIVGTDNTNKFEYFWNGDLITKVESTFNNTHSIYSLKYDEAKGDLSKVNVNMFRLLGGTFPWFPDLIFVGTTEYGKKSSAIPTQIVLSEDSKETLYNLQYTINEDNIITKIIITKKSDLTNSLDDNPITITLSYYID